MIGNEAGVEQAYSVERGGMSDGEYLVSQFQAYAVADIAVSGLVTALSIGKEGLDNFLRDGTNAEKVRMNRPESDDARLVLSSVSLAVWQTEQSLKAARLDRGRIFTELTEHMLHDWNGRKLRVEAVEPGTGPIEIVKRTPQGKVHAGRIDRLEAEVYSPIEGANLVMVKRRGFLGKILGIGAGILYSTPVIGEDGEPLVKVTFLE